MNKEEKEAIEFLKFSLLDYEELDTGVLENIDEKRKTLLNYIDKLQKELKDSINARFELQRRIDKLLKENETLKENNLSYQQELAKAWKENEELKRKTYKAYINDKGEIQFVFDNYISKDKIKEALGDKNIPDEMILTYIETLASENNRLEDIEDRKVQIEYNNVFNKGVRSVEDKIRNKIKELEETSAKELRYDFLMNRDEVKRAVIEILKELLN